MRRNNRPSTVLLLCAAVFASSIQTGAMAGVISTQELIGTIDREAAIARVDAVLARAEVRAELDRLGVDPAETQARVAALTEQELALLANDLESLPAGGDLLGVIGVVFLVLLILELVGVIDIFNRI